MRHLEYIFENYQGINRKIVVFVCVCVCVCVRACACVCARARTRLHSKSVPCDSIVYNWTLIWLKYDRLEFVQWKFFIFCIPFKIVKMCDSCQVNNNKILIAYKTQLEEKFYFNKLFLKRAFFFTHKVKTAMSLYKLYIFYADL
jgi:hypothetical protein